MAKQKHGHPDYRSQRLDSPKHRPPQPSGSLVYPSSSVLSILATIAASSQTADGSPLPLPTPPPSFLCPFIEHDSFQARALPSTATSTSTIYPTPSPSLSTSTTSSPKSGKIGQLADKFVQGDDGLWRKTEEWTLFGSTCCSTPDLVIDTAQTTAPVTTIQSDQLDSVLPAGWNSTAQTTNRTDSIIILSLAIVLAVSICVFMIGCIIWRRRRKKQAKREKKMHDVELKTRGKANVEDPSEDGEREKEAREKLHGWAKASARWKENIRHSARRRKNRRRAAPTGRGSPQSPMLTEAREASLPPSSPSSSRRHSITPIREDFHSATTHSPENSPTATQPLPTPTPSSPRIISSPPAYIFPTSQVRPEDYLEEASHVSSGSGTSRPESLLFCRHDFPPAPEDNEIPYQAGYDGHVAIDDKAHLARMAGLVSSPPANEESTGESSLPVHESAPEWHDGLEEELQPHPDTAATPVTPPFKVSIPGFPTPPSKSLLSSTYFDGHSYLEDIPVLDSMPPYEIGPSALPFEDILHPSAPPLSNDDRALEHWESSAPEASDSECHIHIPSSPTQPPLSRQSSTSSARPSAPPDQARARRGENLPIYQP